MGNGKQTRPFDGVQIQAGEYILKQGPQTVGKLHVENISGPEHTKEHWLLYSSFCCPSAANPVQEIRFEYRGETGDLKVFLEQPPAGTTYIIAECVEQKRG